MTPGYRLTDFFLGLVLIILFVLLLTGCSTPQLPPLEPAVVTKTVEVPVSTPCKVDVPNRPAFPDTKDALQTAPDIGVRAKLLAAGRLLHLDYEGLLETALTACVAHPTS